MPIFAASAVVISAIAASAVLIEHRRAEALQGAGRNFDTISIAVAEQTAQAFTSVSLALEGLSEELDHRRAISPKTFDEFITSQDFHGSLVRRMSGIPQIDTLSVADADGRILNFARFWPVPNINIADRDYFKALSNQELGFYISEPVQNRGNGTWTVYLARPWSIPGQKFHGVLLASIKLEYFENFFRLLSGQDKIDIALRLTKGELLAQYPESDRLIGSPLRSTSLAANMIATGGQHANFREIDRKGEMRLSTARKVENFPLIVIVSKTQHAVLASWRTDSFLLALGASGAVLLAILLMVIVKQHAKDFADRIRTEQALARAAAAEEATKLKTNFLANMSHELRTPLNAVIGFSEIMKVEMHGPISQPTYKGYISDIHSAAVHLLDIINSVLDFSKADAGKALVARVEFDPADLVRRVCRMVTWRAEKGNVELLSDTSGVTDLLVTDECKLRQAVLNIVMNAVKFTPPGGKVTISAVTNPHETEIVVKDTGIGISNDDLPTVFAPFGQVDSGLDRSFEGSGLGVPLAATNVALIGGTLNLESQVGRGTKVTIRVPNADRRSRII